MRPDEGCFSLPNLVYYLQQLPAIFSRQRNASVFSPVLFYKLFYLIQLLIRFVKPCDQPEPLFIALYPNLRSARSMLSAVFIASQRALSRMRSSSSFVSRRSFSPIDLSI